VGGLNSIEMEAMISQSMKVDGCIRFIVKNDESAIHHVCPFVAVKLHQHTAKKSEPADETIVSAFQT
jgi:hypothetical protein